MISIWIYKQLEGQQATQNQKNIQTYIKQINNYAKGSATLFDAGTGTASKVELKTSM